MNKKKQHEQEMGENELVSWIEEKFGYLKPYWSQIALGVCVLFLVAIASAFFWQRTQATEAAKWQNLSIAQRIYRRNLDNEGLKNFAAAYPDDKAGLWAMLFAADAEMRSGLADFGGDRKAGFDKIRKAQQFYQQVVDSDAEKSTLLQRRSLYGLAYAFESSGEFESARNLYQQLVDVGDDNPLADESARGLERTTNPKYVGLFETFRDYEAAPELAPGMRLPPRPDISFPAAQPDMGGGDFGEASSPDPKIEVTEDATSGPDDAAALESNSSSESDSSGG